MRYPRVNNCLKYYRNPDGTCRIVNYCTDQEYNLSYGIVCKRQALFYTVR